MRIVSVMSPRTGRPPSDNPRKVGLALRLTADEEALLREAASKAEQPVTIYVREKALAAARRQRVTRPAGEATG